MSSQRADLDPLLNPQSIAVVGASPDSWYSSQLIDNLLDYGFDGDLYLVNPGREEAWGRPCYDDITEVPEIVDLAVISIPREYVVQTVETAGEIGIPAALIITAGFAEADDDGSAMEATLGELAASHDIRLCGPNCLGVVNTLEDITLTSTASRQPTTGSVGLVSHSGALAFTTFFERGMDEDLGFAYIVSTGNEADLAMGDYIEYLASDDRVDVICAYIEGVDDGTSFLNAADAAVREGVPVLTVKVGRSDVAEQATISHTGSVTGNDEIWDAAFDQVGIQRVPDIPDLLDQASIHRWFEPPESDAVCIASTSGGLASLLADFCSEYGLSLPDIEGETERQLVGMEELLTFGSVNNPIDIRGYGADHLQEIADILFADDRYSAYIFAIGLSAVDDRAEAIAADLCEIAERAPGPVVCLWTGRKEPEQDRDEQPFERVRNHLPLYYDPETAVRSLASLVEFGSIRQRYEGSPSRRTLIKERAQSRSLAPSPGVQTWQAATEILEEFGISTVPTELVTSGDEAVEAAARLGYPVSMKVDATAIPHRTDADAVRLAVGDDSAARAAYDEIVANARAFRPDAEIEGVLVQSHVSAPVETMIGIVDDESLGSVVSFGIGGTAVEVFEDQTHLVPPFTEADVRAAMDGTTLKRIFDHDREGASPDIDSFVDLVVDVGTLAAEADDIEEMDLNPVLVSRDGCAIVDVLLVASD